MTFIQKFVFGLERGMALSCTMSPSPHKILYLGNVLCCICILYLSNYNLSYFIVSIFFVSWSENAKFVLKH